MQDSEIALLVPYRGQLALHNSIRAPDINVPTIDAAQGKENIFFILDLTTTWGGGSICPWISHGYSAFVYGSIESQNWFDHRRQSEDGRSAIWCGDTAEDHRDT